MSLYRVRVHVIGALGFVTQADHYHDYEMESGDSLEVLAGRLATKGFLDPKHGRWIMPGAIVWVEPA